MVIPKSTHIARFQWIYSFLSPAYSEGIFKGMPNSDIHLTKKCILDSLQRILWKWYIWWLTFPSITYTWRQKLKQFSTEEPSTRASFKQVTISQFHHFLTIISLLSVFLRNTPTRNRRIIKGKSEGEQQPIIAGTSNVHQQEVWPLHVIEEDRLWKPCGLCVQQLWFIQKLFIDWNRMWKQHKNDQKKWNITSHKKPPGSFQFGLLHPTLLS